MILKDFLDFFNKIEDFCGLFFEEIAVELDGKRIYDFEKYSNYKIKKWTPFVFERVGRIFPLSDEFFCVVEIEKGV